MKLPRCSTVIICLVSAAALEAQDMTFELRIDSPATVTAGDEFEVSLRGSSSLDLLGYAAHLTYDPAVLSVASTENSAFFSGTVWEAADFLAATDDPAAGTVIVGVVIDVTDQNPADPRLVAAGGDLQFLNLSFEAAEVQSATTTTIDFSDNIDGNLLADASRDAHDTSGDLTLVPATIDIVPAGSVFLRGDCNGDGDATGSVTDALFILKFNFMGGAEPPCLAACDANGDGHVVGQVSDAVYMLLFNFSAGPAPPAPFPQCGPGGLPTDDELGCESSTEVCA